MDSPDKIPCGCNSYSFPHRSGGGKCSGERYVCNSCGDSFEEPELVDFGIGSYEYWGAPGVDTDIRESSPCCEAEYTDRLGFYFANRLIMAQAKIRLAREYAKQCPCDADRITDPHCAAAGECQRA